MEQIAPTQSVLNADGDEGTSELDLSHVAKAQNLGRGEGQTAKSLVSYSQSKENADETYDQIMAARGTLSGSMDNLKGSVKRSMEQHKTEVKDEVCKEVEGVVKTLTEEMTDRKGALNKEQAERKHDNEMSGNKIESERRETQEELIVLRDDTKTIKTGSCGALSSAASTGFGLGSTFAPPPLAARWQDGWVPRKIGVKEWVTDL